MAAHDRIPLLDVRDLVAVGEPLPLRVLDPQDRLLLNVGQRLVDNGQWRALVERGGWVERGQVEALRAALAARDAAAAPPPVVRTRSIFDVWEQRVWVLDDLLRRLLKATTTAAAGRPGGVAAPGSADPQLARELEACADEQLALLDRDVDIALFAAMRQDDRRFALYALTHAMHSTTLAVLTARQLGWDAVRIRTLARAALTMNVSMLELQASMAEQTDPPSKAQRDQIRSHPLRSVQVLQAVGIDDAAWLQTVLEHHEQPGGGGYPRGVPPGETAQLLRAADVFMAKISPRAQRSPMTPPMAARQLFQQEGGAPLATALIRAIGVYPPGCLVSLKSGEAAVVTRRGSNPSAPQVATLSDRQGRPVPDTQHRDTAQADHAVAGPLADPSPFPRVLPERVYGLVPADL